jgi:exosome complex RNA-binding protein Rrp4
MATLARELTVSVRWPNLAEDRSVLVASGTPLPFEMDVVVGRQEIQARSLYEVDLRSGTGRVLHVSGAVPAPKEMKEDRTVFSADAWIRCRITPEEELQYEIHLGPPGMDQPKACHKGHMALAPK